MTRPPVRAPRLGGGPARRPGPLLVDSKAIPLVIGRSDGVLSVLRHSREDTWDRSGSVPGFSAWLAIGSRPSNGAKVSGRGCGSGLNAGGFVAISARAVAGGRGGCATRRRARGTTCRGRRTPSRWSISNAGSPVGIAAFARCQRRWATVRGSKRRELQELFAANRRLFKASVLREQLDRLWTYQTRPGALNFLLGWLKALRWQRLPEMERLRDFLLTHLEGIAAYCDHRVRFGVVEAVNTTIKAVIRRARRMRDGNRRQCAPFSLRPPPRIPPARCPIDGTNVGCSPI